MLTETAGNAKGDPARQTKFLATFFHCVVAGVRLRRDRLARRRHLRRAAVIDLTPAEIVLQHGAALSDWSAVEPSIFSNVYERTLNPVMRSQLGAHYTGEADTAACAAYGGPPTLADDDQPAKLLTLNLRRAGRDRGRVTPPERRAGQFAGCRGRVETRRHCRLRGGRGRRHHRPLQIHEHEARGRHGGLAPTRRAGSAGRESPGHDPGAGETVTPTGATSSRPCGAVDPTLVGGGTLQGGRTDAAPVGAGRPHGRRPPGGGRQADGRPVRRGRATRSRQSGSATRSSVFKRSEASSASAVPRPAGPSTSRRPAWASCGRAGRWWAGEARVRGVLPVTRRCMAWRGRTARRATVS